MKYFDKRQFDMRLPSGHGIQTEMEFFSNTLKSIVDAEFGGSGKALAAKTSISPSMISRLMSGKIECSPTNLRKLCAELNRNSAVKLTIARLRDACPPEMRSSIDICSANSSRVEENPPQWTCGMDADLEAAFQTLARRVRQHPEVREWLLITARLMGRGN